MLSHEVQFFNSKYLSNLWLCSFALFQKWKSCGLHENLRLPLPNEFVPTCFDLLPRETDVGYKMPFQ